MKGTEVTCVNCNHTGQYVGGYIRCHNCHGSLYVKSGKKRTIGRKKMSEVLYRCYNCNKQIEEDNLIVEETRLNKMVKYKFFHEECKDVPAE